MAKSQKKSGRETRKPKAGSGAPSKGKLPRYLRDSEGEHVQIPKFKPEKKAPPAS
jgi:hypothetical protein